VVNCVKQNRKGGGEESGGLFKLKDMRPRLFLLLCLKAIVSGCVCVCGYVRGLYYCEMYFRWYHLLSSHCHSEIRWGVSCIIALSFRRRYLYSLC